MSGLQALLAHPVFPYSPVYGVRVVGDVKETACAHIVLKVASIDKAPWTGIVLDDGWVGNVCALVKLFVLFGMVIS